MIDLTKHAEAIWAAAFPLGKAASPASRQAILTACAALFDAGAEAMRDAAADTARRWPMPASTAIAVAVRIRAIDPASLREAK